MHLTLTTDPAESDVRIIHDSLYAFNRERVPALRQQRDDRYTVCLYESDGRLAGGAICYFEWGWLFVDTLWVAHSMRGRGYGRRILSAAESYAVSCGITKAYLYTADFQGRDFYRKQQYQVSGTIHDKPPGHTLYYLQKHGLRTVALNDAIVIQAPPETDTVQRLEAGLLAHADDHVPFQKTHEIAVLLRDDNQVLQGGLTGHAAWNWFNLELLWIAQSARGQGYGTQMLSMLAAFCRTHDLRGIVTTSADFQALSFYTKQHFQVIQTLAHHPPGHRTCTLANYL